MLKADQENAVAGKSILKRRVRSETKPAELAARTDPVADDDGASDACKRYVTFDETITVKNDKDRVVRKPLKLELVIDNWKSSAAKTEPEAIGPDPGIVRRLVDEFNTIDDTLTDNPDNDRATLPEEDKVKEDEPIRKNQTHIPSLSEALESVNLTTTDV
ncbi:uncharacterized protein LOC112685373 isoform X2 [Sipha flava]|uniref:Uncharacterized protein LOC112685373 isoform X2 n=1 Tax=Sipha flava TaxID=143950 RepID=A0A2S2Q0F4_9HEMI|nr:uncharacterized protein LOC112685373 isoform X2 [Sipha flava]